MRVAFLGLGALAHAVRSSSPSWQCPVLPPVSVASCSAGPVKCPSVDGAVTFVGGKLTPWVGAIAEVVTPILDEATGKPGVIGRLAQMNEADALEALAAATAAWDGGQGAWPQARLADRIAAVERFLSLLQEQRGAMVEVLTWEICKTSGDAAKEFDRTMEYAAASIAAAKQQWAEGSGARAGGAWPAVGGGVAARVVRGPVGVNLMLAPFNYPLNEMYAMLIPALLMGNTVVMKLPNVGGLPHVLTAPSFAAALPPGVVNFVSGSGRLTCGPLMATGGVDMLGFIGGAKAADALIKSHPAPHRLRVFSQLEGKNMGIVLKDADLDVAARACREGALAFNGQRCTAIKLILVHESVAEAFLEKLVAEVGSLKAGLPWEAGVSITPLPFTPAKPAFLEALIADAVGKGARVVNAHAGGGERRGALFVPAVVYPVTPDMRLWHEEQFGPVVPVGTFQDPNEVARAAKGSWSGQQAAIFTTDPTGAEAGPLVDSLAPIVGRVNVNAQCQRGPDSLPFSGRRSSAMGTMSVTEALRAFSVETVVAYPAADGASAAAVRGIEASSKFLASL